MRNFSLPAFNLLTSVTEKFRSALLLPLSIVGGWLLYATCFFSAAQIAVLLVSLAVSALINQHEASRPSTKIKLNAADFTCLAGILLLGVPGGVWLAASVCAVHYRLAAKDKSLWIFDGFARIVSTLTAGVIFYSAIEPATDLTGNFFIKNEISFGWLTLAAVVSTTVYCLISNVFNLIANKSEDDLFAVSELLKAELIRFRNSFLCGLIPALLLYFSLRQFGLLFGVVILLAVIVGRYVYLIHHSLLAEKTKEITESGRVHLATVEALATAIDARDQIGSGHVCRTRIYAVGIGKILEVSDDELKALNTGALLHDIGKLAVPDHILNKPGRLTPAEMEKIKIHSRVGAAILEKVNFSYPVVPTVKYHHEMWDGSGYPDGLKGEEIPLAARILSVADAYDTLRGARPYRPAVSRDEARRFLLKGSGTQFDRKIVDVFLRNLQKIEAEVAAHGLFYNTDEENVLAELPIIFDEDSDQDYVEQIKRANREVYTLYELARVFSSSVNLEETLSLFVQKIGELVPSDTCVVYLMDESQSFATAAYVQGENKSLLNNKRVKVGEGATGFVLKKRQSVYSIKPSLDFIFSQPKLPRDYTAMISLPLIGNQKMLGAVSLYSYDLKNYEEEHMRLLETVARIASDAMGMSLQHAASETRALTDPMTGLPNARSLRLQFEKETARAGRHGSNFQVLMLDLDGFKAVNDTFGHNVGDKLLKEIAQVLRGQLRDYDFLARYAGDEFIAIVPETGSREILELCERMEKAVFNFVLPVDEEQSAQVGVSIGAACYPKHGSTFDQVVASADKAMYAAKAVRKARRAAEIDDLINEILQTEPFAESKFVVELDESHIISSAIN